MEIRTPDIPTALEPAAELDQLGDEIAELSAHIEDATAHLLDLIREFDARGGWNTGFRSCAAWLAWRVGLDPGAARERVRVAHALGTLPLLARALARGELSYSKVRALTRVATPETEAQLLAVGRAGTAAHVERIVRAWRRVDRQGEAREATARHARRSLQVYPDEDGMLVVRGRLEPEVGAMLVRALDAAREALYQRTRAAGAEGGATDPDDPAGAPAGAPGPGPRVPLPGLRGAPRPGPSPPLLGERRPDPARQPHAPLPAPSPGRPRGRLPCRARLRGRAALQHPGGPADSRGAGAPGRPGRPDAGPRRRT